MSILLTEQTNHVDPLRIADIFHVLKKNNVEITEDKLRGLQHYINQYRVLPSIIVTRREVADQCGISESTFQNYLNLMRDELKLPELKVCRWNFDYSRFTFCARCGIRFSELQLFCVICGKRVRSAPKQRSKRRVKNA